MTSDDLSSFLSRHARPYDPAGDDYRRPPFAAPVKATKATPIYNAHSYHTKVPPEGIVPYILHYTDPGDLILDPFCGSGMTGVAAMMCAHPPAGALQLVPDARPGPRYAILNDLSPAAVHIAYNYCTPVDVEALRREFERIRAAVQEEFGWLYGTTCDRCGGPATIQYTIWSDVLECARCRAELVLWDVAVDHESGEMRSRFTCPRCGKEQTKREARWLRSVPVVTNYECHGGCRPKRSEHPTTEAEKRRIAEIEAAEIPYWYPKDALNPEREQVKRDNLLKRGIKTVADFYTRRNLWAFARLWHEANQVSNPRVSLAIKFVLTSINNYISKRQSYGGGGGGLSGTLYIPSLCMEKHVGLVFARKVDDFVNKYIGYSESQCFVSKGSASHLRGIAESSVDYIFTDPPFGSNIFYADCNLIWEAWLGEFTDPTEEAVVHRSQKVNAKSIADYARLMTDAFREMYRVLKPGRWASVVFHNSDDRIWQVILDAAEAAGFELAEINSFDKGQLSFKGVRGAKGIERVTNKDIVLNLRKPRPGEVPTPNGRSYADQQEVRIVEAIAAFLEKNPPPQERTLQGLWNHALYGMLRDGTVTLSMAEVEALLPHYFKQVDGRWYLRGEAVIEGGLGLIVRDEASAIAWLSGVLRNEPQTTGDLIPQWRVVTREVSLSKTLDQILEENFWRDERTGRWRVPTDEERRRKSAREEVAAQARLRVIRRFLEGGLDRRPGDLELCEWIRFCYQREQYAEAVALFPHLDESRVPPEEYRQVRKIVEVCRLKLI
jgi:DNA modification methylase